ncbi:MAG: helix-turn-helix domain-containing protein [Bacteroidales bacterium]|nr:helix-turn-helix domain-containing protein [Bacteroidales bacterium]MBR1435382.1 helix-turn-helix domain-containing protein [Bacteroidales bacterium]
MGKRTFGKVMPQALSRKMEIMGQQIMLARKRRHLSMQDIADRATVTRLTVSKVEHGDPTVSMGIYARVLYALNLENDIMLLAADDALGRQLQDEELL